VQQGAYQSDHSGDIGLQIDGTGRATGASDPAIGQDGARSQAVSARDGIAAPAAWLAFAVSAGSLVEMIYQP